MRANSGKGNIPERDLWETKQDFFDKLNDQYNFDFDCCASEENTKCERYSSDFKRIVSLEKTNFIAWMNPPFSKALEMFEHFFKVVEKGVAIYRCDNMETKIWQEIIFPEASWVFILNKRLTYEGMEGNGSRFPSALIGKGVEPPTIDGTILLIKRGKENEP